MTTETGARLSYGIAEAAEMLGVGRTTIYELVRTGQLATLKIGHRRARKHVEQLALAEREMP
ncbi:MAG: helix-turn-helix domain-containing protein, partial [Acidimicrobiales bacterium]